MGWIPAGLTAGSVVVAAVLGNVFLPKDAMAWFRALRRPQWMIPFWAFLVVGFVYYVLIGVVLYRSLDRDDVASTALTYLVIIGNEVWNVVFFGRRSARAGYFGMLAFAVPVAVLLAAVVDDPLSAILVGIYLAWVLYDIAWTRALWHLNPS